MADTKKTEKKFSTYKGRPLVRCNDEIYYGSMEEPYVIRMQIKSKKDVNGTEIADKVTVQLMATDPYLSPRKQLVKSSEKKGLFLAMDIADIWLERALANEQEDYEGLKKGVEMTFNGLMTSLEKLGVTTCGEVGEKFDPNFHNAVMHVEDDSLEENVITDVFQKGYKIGDKVVRPAMVKTAN